MVKNSPIIFHFFKLSHCAPLHTFVHKYMVWAKGFGTSAAKGAHVRPPMTSQCIIDFKCERDIYLMKFPLIYLLENCV